MTTTTVQVPAGWYPDPVTINATGGALHQRWWDGRAWTTHTAPFASPYAGRLQPSASTAIPTVTLGTVTSAPATLGPRESARLAEQMPLHSVTNPSQPRHAPRGEPHGSYEPFGHRQRVEKLENSARGTSRRNPTALRVHTVSIWLIATMPITQALLIVSVFSALPPESSAWTRALTVALPFVLYAALAAQDSRLMEGSGHLRTAPWWSALLTPPVYLAIRGVRVARSTGSAAWPLLVWIVVQLGVIAVWWVVDPEAVQGLLRLLG